MRQGLPPGWEELLNASGISKAEIQGNPREVMRVLSFQVRRFEFWIDFTVQNKWQSRLVKESEPIVDQPLPPNDVQLGLGI